MKLIVAGVRKVRAVGKKNRRPLSAAEIDWILSQIDMYCDLIDTVQIVSGKAEGCDQVGELWAAINEMPVVPFLPDYAKYPSRVAPIKRNEEMARYADAAICFWDGISRGTKNMIDNMKKLNKPVKVYTLDYYDRKKDYE